MSAWSRFVERKTLARAGQALAWQIFVEEALDRSPPYERTGVPHPTPTLSLNMPNFGDRIASSGCEPLLAAAQAADEAGVDRLVVTDHVVNGPDASAYTWGRFPTGPDSPWLEPLTLLSVLAGRTSRIRLGTGIVIAALRGAAVLAKTAATLDLLSGGRFDLGVGTGWQAKEYEAAGLDFARRGALLDDTLAGMRALWDGAPASLDRAGLAFDDVYCSPRPAPGQVPIWVSGSLTAPVMRRLVAWGDGWIPIMDATDDDLARGVDQLREAFAAAGRDPDTLQVRGRLPVVRDENKSIDIDATMEGVPSILAAGATDLMAPLPALDRDPQVAASRLPALVDAFARATGRTSAVAG